MEVMRNVEPKDDFLQKVRELANENNIILIFDDILAPPTRAATGLIGEFRTEVSALTSSSSNSPEKDGRNFVIACKLA